MEYCVAILSDDCLVAQSCPTLCDPWTVAHQASPSMGFSRQEYWSGVPFPSKISSHGPQALQSPAPVQILASSVWELFQLLLFLLPLSPLTKRLHLIRVIS